MKLVIHKSSTLKRQKRLKKKVQIRKKISGTLERPRLCVYRSGRHMYAQLINDVSGETLVSASSFVAKSGSGCEVAKAVGKSLAVAARSKGVETVVFDRNGFVYHGRVKSLADGAREGGLNF